MTEYIAKDELLGKLKEWVEEEKTAALEYGGESIICAECLEDVTEDIKELPIADAVPGALFRELRDELCIHCGKYTEQHLGACNGCKWRANNG